MMSEHGLTFDLSGEVLCIDFANTLDERSTDAPVERLPTFGDLLRFDLETGALDRATADRLEGLAERRQLEAEAARQIAIAQREVLYRVLAAIAAGEAPDDDDIDGLNRAIARTFDNGRIIPDDGGFRWGWREDPLDFERALWPVIDSVRELLLHGDLSRLRVCSAHDCSWLFYDTSRNRSRKWCDMGTCGNRAKVSRYRERIEERTSKGE